MKQAIKILVVGLGNMGRPHALAYHYNDNFDVVGLCSRSATTLTDLPPELEDYPRFDRYEDALNITKPDAVCICTWPNTHAEYTIKAFEAGAHVFLEKPIAETVDESNLIIKAAEKYNRKLVIGYILRHHPSWTKFVELTKDLGKPLVMRMNLNQQSSGDKWGVHKKLLESLSPIVDCGVHYLDIMCQMTGATPVRVHGIGVRLSDEIADDMYNYGQLQVTFNDGSVGWYESGWGPMMSETAFFIKDVIGPKGSISIVAEEQSSSAKSDDIDMHTKTSVLLKHSSTLDADGNFSEKDVHFNMDDEPDHNELCAREQRYFTKAILENIDLTTHWQDAVNSLRIALAADESIRTGKVVEL